MAEYAPTPPPVPPTSASPAAPPPPPYPPYAPPPSRRLTRSSRERMWAGVAGGIAEYFDLDPSLVRLLWVAATLVTGGAGVPVYILAWIILPRDDRPASPSQRVWSDWSEEFHNETARLAQEARRVADDVSGKHWHAPPTAESDPSSQPTYGPTAGPTSATVGAETPTQDPEPWWQSERYVERRRSHHHHPRSTGVVLVGLGVLLLAANAGLFSWVEWRTMWPLIFIGLGVVLLGRQSGWWSR